MKQLRDLYPAHIQTLSARYSKVISESAYDALVILSGQSHLRHPFDDAEWPLVPHPFFAHWLPLREADCALIIVPGQTPTLIRCPHSDFWEGPAPLESNQFEELLTCKNVQKDAASKEAPKGKTAVIAEKTPLQGPWSELAADINPAPLLTRLEQTRTCKTEYEIACIGTANNRAARGHNAAFHAFHTGVSTELELHLEYLKATDQDDFATPYKNIVALNQSASILHHCHYGKNAVGPTSSLLIDAGAKCIGYASDITRTQVKGKGSDDFQNLIDSLDALQLKLCDALVPGLQYEAVHDQAHDLLANALLENDLATGNSEELVQKGITRVFFPHGLGHSLGIQVHDVGCRQTKPKSENAFLRTTATIEENMVFTVEPGCYFIDSLLEELKNKPESKLVNWKKVDELTKFGGIRIEDNIQIRAEGNRNLTRVNWPD